MQKFLCRCAGLTLPELIIVLSLLSVVGAFILPAYSSLASRNALDVRQMSLHAALNYARSRALVSGVPVVVCPLAPSGGCSQNPGDWSRGWLIFSDPDALNDCYPNDAGDACQQGEGKLLQITRVSDDIRTVTNQNVARRVRFNALGMSYGYTGRFTFCSQRDGVLPRGLVIPQTGRVRHATPAEWLSCPG